MDKQPPSAAVLAEFDQNLAGSQRTLDDLVATYRALRAKGTSEMGAMQGLIAAYRDRDRIEPLVLLAVAVRQLAEERQ